MSDPEVASDYTRVQDMAKEQANLRDVVGLARELRAIDAEVGDLRAMLREGTDEEIAQLAREEMAELESAGSGRNSTSSWRWSRGPERPEERYRRDSRGHGRGRGRTVRGRPIQDVQQVRSASRLGRPT